MKYTYTALAVISACASFNLAAQTPEDESDIERLVVVANRVEVPIRELTTSVTVFDETELSNRGFVNLADSLRIAPSISVSRTGGLGSQTSLRIRGEQGFRTQVRVDGMNIADPTGVQIGPQFEHLLSSNVARVEILRGSQGLAYGADAGGVVNVTSRQYEQLLEGRLFAETGTYGTHNIAADVGGIVDNSQYYFSAQSLQSDGFNARTDDTSADEDGYDNQSFHTRLAHQFNDAFSVNAVIRLTEGEGEYDNCFDNTFTRSDDCHSDFTQTQLRTEANYTTEQSNHTFAFSKNWIDRELFTVDLPAFETEGDTERLEYIGNVQVSEVSQWVFGADWQTDAITQGDVSDRDNLGAFIEYQGNLDDSTFVTLGGRYDDNDDFGTHFSYRLGVAQIWQVHDYEVKLRSAYGTGFRAPSLFEVAYNRGPFAFEPASSTELSEEQSAGFEAGLSIYDARTFNYEIVYFNQRVEDAIFFDPTGFSGYLQDEGLSRSEGVEFIASHQLSEQWRVTGNYVYTNATDTAENVRVRSPRHILNVGTHYQWQQLQMSANVRTVNDVQGLFAELDDYTVVDVTAQYAFSNRLTLHARVENALDEDYQEAIGFNTPERTVNLGASYTF